MLFIKKEKGLWKNIFLLLAAFLTSLAITMNMEVIETVEVGIENPIFKIVYKLIEIVNQTMADRGLLLTLLTFSLFAVYKKIWIENSIEIIRYSKGLALFFSIMYTGGKAFEYGNSLSVIYASSIRIMISLYVSRMHKSRPFCDLCILDTYNEIINFNHWFLCLILINY